MGSSTGGKGQKKKDRQKKSAQNLRYINEQRHDKSHVRRITKHLKRWPGDKAAQSALDRYRARLGVRKVA